MYHHDVGGVGHIISWRDSAVNELGSLASLVQCLANTRLVELLHEDSLRHRWPTRVKLG
jgi:hypothetical protein